MEGESSKPKTEEVGAVGPSHAVEKIINKHVNDEGKTYYLIQWKGCSLRETTWEPAENVHCPELVLDYEKYQAPKDAEIRSKISKNIGFARGLEPEKILSVTNNTPGDQLFYLMQWKGAEKYDMVSATEAVARCPNVVLEFLERHFVFTEYDKSKILKTIVPLIRDLEHKNNVKITGTTLDKYEKLILVMEWEGCILKLVRYDQAKAKIPLVVIDYFQKRLGWRVAK